MGSKLILELIPTAGLSCLLSVHWIFPLHHGYEWRWEGREWCSLSLFNRATTSIWIHSWADKRNSEWPSATQSHTAKWSGTLLPSHHKGISETTVTGLPLSISYRLCRGWKCPWLVHFSVSRPLHKTIAEAILGKLCNEILMHWGDGSIYQGREVIRVEILKEREIVSMLAVSSQFKFPQFK